MKALQADVRDAVAKFEAEGYLNPATIEAWEKAADLAFDAEVERRKRHAQVREAIAALPQLFIAV
jgi:hypothetical protein